MVFALNVVVLFEQGLFNMKKQKLMAPQKRGFFSRIFRRNNSGNNHTEVSKSMRYRAFGGAKQTPMFANWKTENWSADSLLKADLNTLRSRSRSLSRDNDYMRKFLSMIEANVIGPKGFNLQMRVQKVNGVGADTEINRAIEEAFDVWSRRGRCDVTGMYSFADLQRLLIRAVARDGEALVRRIRGFDNDHGYALQVLDIDRLDVDLNKPATKGANAIRMGIELNGYSCPVAYWLRVEHPGDGAGISVARSERIPAHEIKHIFRHDRPEERRGYPWVASAIIGLTNIGGYQEAAIIAARIGASKMGFYTQSIDSVDGVGGLGFDAGDGGDLIDSVEPGMMQELPPGYGFQSFDPDYPHANYDAFIKASLRGVASGMGVSYHSLANDLEGVNFSSIRSGTLEEREWWMTLQNWFANAFLYDIFEDWLQFALLKGVIKTSNGEVLSAAKYKEYLKFLWQGRRWQWVDPLKDIKAHEAAVNLGIKSRRDVCDEQGVDFDDVLEQLHQEHELMKGLGLAIVGGVITVEEEGADDAKT